MLTFISVERSMSVLTTVPQISHKEEEEEKDEDEEEVSVMSSVTSSIQIFNFHCLHKDFKISSQIDNQ